MLKMEIMLIQLVDDERGLRSQKENVNGFDSQHINVCCWST